MSANHMRFIARTVLVKDNQLEAAYRTLDRILRVDKVLELHRQRMYYEKPFQKRRRISYERCKRIYDNSMNQKIEFLMRKNRPDPWLR
ncbi:28S ribosomal protein S21, mitochondrial [Octopus bimaculoides]|uniref:Mitochondrial ribosomal protein S21 n=1 Tax=Octopus bimaculoides TaxID=37653 RepID=A0A0L8I084_OCTBM|nr:28S ribosomal protein S21, mitochondrial [Octopus bimaculoides]|eukprot:XP_014767843.1 PREDICTED: 28S ribosomal protein S21, mitochondrial-like [Octopus bimaculoides]